MNVLYSVEQKGQPLGSEALTDRRTIIQKLKKKKIELFDAVFEPEAVILCFKKYWKILIIEIKYFKNCVITCQNRC